MNPNQPERKVELKKPRQVRLTEATTTPKAMPKPKADQGHEPDLKKQLDLKRTWKVTLKPNEQDEEGYISEDPSEDPNQPKQYVSRSGLKVLTKEEYERRRRISDAYWELIKLEADEDLEEVKRQRKERKGS